MFSFHRVKNSRNWNSSSYEILKSKMCVFLFLLSFLKICVALDQSGNCSQDGMLTMPPDGKLEGNIPFILIIGWTREHSIFSALYEPEKTFPGYFSFAFLTLIGLEARSCGPAGSVFHNKAKNMPAMFSLAQSMSVKHESDRAFPADSSSPSPGESSILILPFSPNVILLIAYLTWREVQNGIIVEMYSMPL